MSEQVLEVIKKRSSARAYSAEPLTDDELKKIITAGLEAPTGMNRRELHFSVVKGDNEILEELENDLRVSRGQEKQPKNFYYGAPVLIIISAEDDFKWSKVDSGIAVMSMSLAAESLGLGNLIIGCVYDVLNGDRKSYYNKAFDIPEDYSFQIALAIGHKTDNKTQHDYVWEDQVSVIDA